ncbi:LacI family DNA-binding transcriptional regulator [Poriferisphaera sp. WC338]|uniref:LacI family DNA-binding transcriptional regulator n=1 Tax=Poriferisphaera sp. WC338 TaxID=3425129 RepID=UPI003D81C2E4
MSVTISDIAKRAGVSHPVVSKVLHGGRSNVGVSEQTRLRIEKMARDLGYRPHAAGLALRQRKHERIGVLVGGAEEAIHLPQATLAAMTATLTQHNYTGAMVCSGALAKDDLLQSPLFRTSQLDGLIVSYAKEPNDQVLEAIESLGLPSIWINRALDHESVSMDEGNATRMLVEHLASRGYRKILFADYSCGLQTPHAMERFQAFERAAHEHDLEPSVMASQAYERHERVDVTKQWMSRKHRPDAVIANSAKSAMAMLIAAMQMGLRVPEDIAIATYDDGTFWNVPEPQLTAAVSPIFELGRVAAEMAVQKAKQPRKQLDSVLLPYELKIGGTT